jgi:DNA topoisomerase-3
LITAVSPKHIYEAVTVTIDCGGNPFTAKGKTIIEAGWKTQPDEDEDGDDNTNLLELSEGQVFESISASVKEGASSPPKPYTEDTLLAAMNNAGAEAINPDVEQHGLGTPATRAGIIERIIKSGFAERQKKNIIPTDKGKNLISLLPDTLTSPLLTAEWENKLRLVESGELSDKEFMDGITAFISSVVAENSAPKSEFAGIFSEKKNDNPALGLCPRCNSSVREAVKGFFCDSHSCGFKLWKASKFWTAKKKTLTADIVTALLKDGRVAVKGLYSEKSDKKYNAVVVMDDGGSGFVNYKLEFKNGR